MKKRGELNTINFVRMMRIFFVLICGVLMIAAVAGCGNISDDSQPDGDSDGKDTDSSGLVEFDESMLQRDLSNFAEVPEKENSADNSNTNKGDPNNPMGLPDYENAGAEEEPWWQKPQTWVIGIGIALAAILGTTIGMSSSVATNTAGGPVPNTVGLGMTAHQISEAAQGSLEAALPGFGKEIGQAGQQMSDALSGKIDPAIPQQTLQEILNKYPNEQ